MTHERLLDRFVDDAMRAQLDRRAMIRQAMALGISLPALSAVLVQRTAAQQATPAASPLASPTALTPPMAERRPELVI